IVPRDLPSGSPERPPGSDLSAVVQRDLPSGSRERRPRSRPAPPSLSTSRAVAQSAVPAIPPLRAGEISLPLDANGGQVHDNSPELRLPGVRVNAEIELPDLRG